jgi:hypothetical protein
MPCWRCPQLMLFLMSYVPVCSKTVATISHNRLPYQWPCLLHLFLLPAAPAQPRQTYPLPRKKAS